MTCLKVQKKRMQYQFNSTIVICGVFSVLAIVIWRYARWLDKQEGAYNPDFTWATVVVGVGIVLIAYAILAIPGIVTWGSVGLITLLFVVAGSLILAWQYEQYQRRAQERREREAQRDTHTRRQGSD